MTPKYNIELGCYTHSLELLVRVSGDSQYMTRVVEPGGRQCDRVIPQSGRPSHPRLVPHGDVCQTVHIPLHLLYRLAARVLQAVVFALCLIEDVQSVRSCHQFVYSVTINYIRYDPREVIVFALYN